MYMKGEDKYPDMPSAWLTGHSLDRLEAGALSSLLFLKEHLDT